MEALLRSLREIDASLHVSRTTVGAHPKANVAWGGAMACARPGGELTLRTPSRHLGQPEARSPPGAEEAVASPAFEGAT